MSSPRFSVMGIFRLLSEFYSSIINKIPLSEGENMESLSHKLTTLRKEADYTQSEVAGILTQRTGKAVTFKAISHWENGSRQPNIDQFLIMCELYNVDNVLTTFFGTHPDHKGFAKLNELGKSRVNEYIAMLLDSSVFSDREADSRDVIPTYIKLYDIPAAAGAGSFLDSEQYEEMEVDDTVPGDADFALRVSGDSMTPRFVDGQIIFVKEQQSLNIGDIGIFALNGDAFIKKLGKGQLISLNDLYKPIQIHDYDSFYVFGKVVG